MPVIYNPTDENFDTIFEGIPLTLHGVCDEYPVGQMVEVTRAHAGHLLNVFEPRGLVKLEFGDEKNGKKEKKVKAALARNKAFKEKQVIAYNTDNERRKQSGQPYVTPTETVVKYAKQIGIELLSPYAVRTEEAKQTAALMEENKELRGQLSKLMARFDRMMDDRESREQVLETTINDKIDGDITDKDLDFNAKKNRFYKLGADNFKAFMIDNVQEVKAWDDELKGLVRNKWNKLFPTEKCLID